MRYGPVMCGRLLGGVGVDQRQELGACRRLVAERAEHAARDEVGAALVDAAADHAMVRRLDDHGDPARVQHLLDGVGNLRRQALLDLQAFGEDLDHAGELRDPDDPAVRKVADPHPADDRRDVMLAMALERDAAQHDHLVVALDFGEGLAQHLRRILVVTAKILAERPYQPVRRFAQAVAVGVFADPSDDRAERLLGRGVADRLDAACRRFGGDGFELARHIVIPSGRPLVANGISLTVTAVGSLLKGPVVDVRSADRRRAVSWRCSREPSTSRISKGCQAILIRPSGLETATAPLSGSPSQAARDSAPFMSASSLAKPVYRGGSYALRERWTC